MDYLWSPWRYRYISGREPREECLFCVLSATPDKDRANYVVVRAEHNLIVLNLFPYTSGHLMIAPYAHVATLAEAPLAALEEMMRLTVRAEKALGRLYTPDGFNIGMNVGKAAGAGIAGHIHMHVVPRWTGDANYLTVVGETRVLPEELGTTWERLRTALQ